MSSKACKAKICLCVGKALDTRLGQDNRNYLKGFERSVLPFVPNIQTVQVEEELYSDLDRLVVVCEKGDGIQMVSRCERIVSFLDGLPEPT